MPKQYTRNLQNRMLKELLKKSPNKLAACNFDT
jgi:hypothetical protein